jgi:hypothetical protein
LKIKMKTLSFILRSAAVGTLATIACFALPIDLGINGDAQVGPTFINFGNYPLGTIYTPAPGYGNIVVSQPTQGIFATEGVVAGETGMIQSLNAVVTMPGSTLTPDPATAAPFLKFNGGGSNLQVFLTQLLPGSTTGPFSLFDSTNGAVASFNIDGFTYDTTTHSRQDLTGTFSATFNGTSVATLLTEEATGTNIATPFTGTFSATPINAVPEPGSLLLLGSGLLCFGLLSRRKARL